LSASIELHEAPPAGGLRHADLGEHLLGPQRRLEQSREERVRLDHARGAGGAGRDHRGAEGEQDARQIPRGIAVRERSADRADVPHRGIAYLRGRVGDDRGARLQRLAVRNIVVARQGTDREMVPGVTDVGKLGESADVHEGRGPSDP
jgi:hypothetical protein